MCGQTNKDKFCLKLFNNPFQPRTWRNIEQSDCDCKDDEGCQYIVMFVLSQHLPGRNEESHEQSQ
jgi:hypothetical protein